jgi:uncharacterized protein YecE (DUF72 family)
MSNLSLFDDEPPPIERPLGTKLGKLAAQQIYLGTSSWKYEGWLGQVYTEERYKTRGRFSKKKFQETCLSEYAETFPIVCGDFSFYQFPSDQYWSRLFGSAPGSLLYAFKVPEDLTVSTWPTHARYGARGGRPNDNFLNPDLLKDAFLRPLWPYREQVGALILEFGAFSKKTFADAEAFAVALDKFLVALPRQFRYSVEIRNPGFLAPDYLDCLRAHNVAHVFSAWARMPELTRQIAMPGAFTADFTVTRALLKHGRGYENAVKLFQPYTHIQEPNPSARDALRQLIRQARSSRQPAMIFVNNRLEGNAPATIEAVLESEEI